MQPLTSEDPAQIGSYRLQARLGAGGMGRVYLASTPAGRPVALKVLRSDLSHDRDFRLRFQQEIQAAQRVRGLYTAELIDADPAAAPPWLATAYVPGPSLEYVIDSGGPMPEATVFRLVAGVAEALQAIHRAGVIHRDLKPSNVLLAQDGPRVIDFGIARALAATPLTRSDVMMGSPDFLSPEQILDLPVTAAIDVFALGSLAAFAATGRVPFGRGHITEVAHRVVHDPPDLTGCPARLLTLIEACLEKQPEARPSPSRVLEFCLASPGVLAGPVPAWPGWGPAGALAAALPGAGPGPGPGPGPASSSGYASSDYASSPNAATAGAATAVLPAMTPPYGPGSAPGVGWSGPGSRRRPGPGSGRVPLAAAGLAAVLLAIAVAVIALTSRLASEHAAAGHASPPRPAATQGAGRAAGGHRGAAVKPAHGPGKIAPVVLLSQGRPVTASSVQGPPWAAVNAVDGNLATRWSSGWSDPQWLEIDLGATRKITKVVLYWERAYATAFQIQVSGNGTTWTDVYSTATGSGGAQTIPVAGSGRYVRMYGTSRSTPYGYSLWEFQVFGR
jgi:hypothetical protein